MRPLLAVALLAVALLLPAGRASNAAADVAPSADPAGEAVDLRAQVMQAEAAFARSMADRDFDAFAACLAEDAVFFGRAGALRGREAVLAAWKPFFEGEQAPFAWRPDTVEVLPSGTLALSSGPVLDRAGRQTSTFNSIWRRDADGAWRVVFDKGCPACAPAP